MPNLRVLTALFGAATLVLLAHASGLWLWFGAHPWWALSGTLWGMALGTSVVLASHAAMRVSYVPHWLRIIGYLFLAFVAAVLSMNGKETFAASYAEDALAGRFWHYGFIGLVAATFGFLSTLCELLALRVHFTSGPRTRLPAE